MGFQKQFDMYCYKDLNGWREMNLLYTFGFAFPALEILSMELAYSFCD